MKMMGHEQLCVHGRWTCSSQLVTWSSPNARKEGGREQRICGFIQERRAAPGSVGSWLGYCFVPSQHYGPKQQQQFPCTNADPEMSLSIDFERKTWSWNYGFDGQALMACHRCAVRLFLLLQMRDRSWTRCKAELLKAGHRLITWICQNQPQFVTPWIYRSPIFLLPVGFP